MARERARRRRAERARAEDRGPTSEAVAAHLDERPAAHLALVALAYLATVWEGLSTPRFPAHDNALYQFPTFLYFANSLADGLGVPRWYPYGGGTPVIVSSPSLFPFLPHKWVGYALFAWTDVTAAHAYEFGLIAGVVVVLAGVWLLVRELTGSREAATVAAVALGTSGAGATVWHQEQLLATITWYPWIALCAVRAARDPRWLPLAAALFGITLGTHYPTIHLLTATCALAAAAALYRRELPARLRAAPGKTWALAATAAAAGAAHIAWVFVHRTEFGSPVRRLAGALGVDSLADYLALNTQQESSAPVAYLRALLSADYGNDDGAVYFASPLVVLLALGGLLRGRREGALLAALAALAAWFSTGIHGGAAQALFTLRFPSVSFFRQWYHFAGPAMLWLACLAGVGFAALASRLRTRPQVLGAAAVACAAMVVHGRANFAAYTRVATGLRRPTDLRYPAAALSSAMRLENPAPSIGLSTPGSLIAYAASLRAGTRCPRAVLVRPTVLPTGAARGFPASLPIDACEGWAAELRPLPADAMRLSPTGVEVDAELVEGHLLVPFDTRLAFDATLDGRPVAAGSAGDGAFVRVRVPAGRHRVALEVGAAPHHATLALQALAAALGVYALRRRRA